MNILDLIFENLVSVFGLKILKILCRRSVSGIQDLFNPGYGIRDKKSRIRDPRGLSRIRNTVRILRFFHPRLVDPVNLYSH
jgi:hypothetical protein